MDSTWVAKRILDDVCNDVMVLNVKNWKELASNRKAWNDVVDKAKTHKWILKQMEEVWYNNNNNMITSFTDSNILCPFSN
jgi:hypothetical protein